MYWRAAAWFIAGFAVAITSTVELGTPHAYLIFACGFVTRTILALAVRQVYGTDLKTLWQRAKPIEAAYWTHALAYIKGEHPTKDPLACEQCRG